MSRFPLRQKLIGDELYVSTTDIAAMLTSAVEDWRLYAVCRPEWDTPLEACAGVLEGVLDQLTVTAIELVSVRERDLCAGSGQQVADRADMKRNQCGECGRYVPSVPSGWLGREVLIDHERPAWTAAEIVRDHLERRGETW